MYKQLILLYTIINIVICFAVARGDTIVKESDRYKISLILIADCDCQDKKNITIHIVDKLLNIEKDVIFANRTVDINDLYLLFNDKILVKGLLGTGGDILTLLNIETGTIIDTIWGRDASLSADMRMIAYTFRFPPHGLPLDRSTVLLVYDLSKSPIENSINGVTNNPEERGFILYPEENRLNDVYFIPPRNEKEQRTITSPILWNATSNMIVFLDSWDGKTNIVIIDISRGLSDPKITIKPLSQNGLVPAKEIKFIDDEQSIEIIPFAVGSFKQGEKIIERIK